MALPHQSIATINDVEFVNLTPLDISPLMSKCEIKVFYIGKNRNGSYINKQTAIEMAKTLRGAPIVGYYKQSKEDFRDHGEKVILDDEGIHFECETKPYGFVSPDSRVWFKEFTEIDQFGNTIIREYLMTEGYLWTEQFPEVQKIYDEDGKPHSMELDGNSLEGHWAEDVNSGVEYFIINDAIISKLCILGDDVEPCYEGSSVTAPEISKSFTMDNKFKKTLFDMMKELEFALQGGKTTVNELENVTVSEETVETPSVENQFELEAETVEVEGVVGTLDDEAAAATEFKKDDDKEEEEENKDSDSDSEESDSEADDKEEEDDDKKKSSTKNSLHTDEEYEALEQKCNDLQAQFDLIKAENEKLVEFKNVVEDQQKDELISKFYMLSDEDKKDVIENKRNYSLEDIEAKLAVIGYHKGVNFDLTADDKNNQNQMNDNTFTVNIDSDTNSLPDWVKAVKEVEKTM